MVMKRILHIFVFSVSSRCTWRSMRWIVAAFGETTVTGAVRRATSQARARAWFPALGCPSCWLTLGVCGGGGGLFRSMSLRRTSVKTSHCETGARGPGQWGAEQCWTNTSWIRSAQSHCRPSLFFLHLDLDWLLNTIKTWQDTKIGRKSSAALCKLYHCNICWRLGLVWVTPELFSLFFCSFCKPKVRCSNSRGCFPNSLL